MKVIYLAGPYRSQTEVGVHRNIQDAERVALEVWRMGAVCICPQKNTAYFGGALPDAAWLEGDKELIRRSDAVLLMNTWSASPGASQEKEFADTIGKAVLSSLDELRHWLARQC